MLLQYANGRAQLPFTSTNIVVSSGGSISSPRTLYFAIQGRNAIGHNLLSNVVGPVAIAANQKIDITLPPAIREAGEYFSDFAISASENNNPNSFVQIARIPAFDSGGSPIALPHTLTLSTDEHLRLSAIVANPSALPTTSLIIGMRRGVSSLVRVFEYDPTSLATPNNESILAASPAPGNWIRVGSFANLVPDVNDAGGCAQDVRSIDESTVQVRPYAVDGSEGPGFRFWLINNEDSEIAAGKRIVIGVTIDEVPRSGLFEGLLRCIFRGYVNTATGALRTIASNGDELRGLNQEVIFENKKTDLILEDDLQVGEAYAIDIYPQFRPEELNNQISQNALIKVTVALALQAGAYVEGGDALGDRIYPDYDRGIVVPQKVGAKCLKRSGMVNSRSFLAINPTHVLGLTPNTVARSLFINSNGSVYLKPISEPQEEFEAIRAKISTQSGVSNPSAWSAPVTLNTPSALEITCTYPSNGINGTVRSNYPDPLLAGNSQGEFNVQLLTLYVRSTVGNTTTIKRFPGQLVVDASEQDFQLSDWNAGETIATIPNAPSPDFCLFEPISASATASGVGSFPTGTIQVAFAYEFDGTQVSAISHSSLNGCLHTSTLNLAEVESAVQFWAEPVADLAALRSLPRANRMPLQERKVSAIAEPYFFDPASLGIDDGTPNSLYARPLDVPPEQAGRWIWNRSNRFLIAPNPPASNTPGIRGDLLIVLKSDPEHPDHGKTFEFNNGWIQRGVLQGRPGEQGAQGSITIFEAPPTAQTPGNLNELGIVLAPSLDDPNNGRFYRYTESGWSSIGGVGGGNGSGGSGGNAIGGVILTPGSQPSETLTMGEAFLSLDTTPFLRESNDRVSRLALTNRSQVWTQAQRIRPIQVEHDRVYRLDLSQGSNFSTSFDDLTRNRLEVADLETLTAGQSFEWFLSWRQFDNDGTDVEPEILFSNQFFWTQADPPVPDANRFYVKVSGTISAFGDIDATRENISATEYDEAINTALSVGASETGDRAYQIDCSQSNLFEIDISFGENPGAAVEIEVVNSAPGTWFEALITWNPFGAPTSLTLPPELEWFGDAPAIDLQTNSKILITARSFGSSLIATFALG